jgi:sialidase-1
MNKIVTTWVLLLLVLSSGCQNRYVRAKGSKDVKPDDTYEYFVAPVGPQNPRNSEAAIIPIKGGSLLLDWTEFYAGNGADHGPARISGKISADGGHTWGDKYIIVENDGGCNVMEVNFLRLKNGDIALFYLQKNTETTDCRIMMRVSSDEGRTWVNQKQLSPDGKYTGLTNGRAIRLRSGRIVLEAWEGEHCYCVLSDDDGITWHNSQRIKPAGGGCWESACIELKDGKVLMLMRTGLGGQYKSISSDGGETWDEPVPTTLPGTAAPVSISRVPGTGDILAVWNNNPGAKSRNPLTAALSKDEGETWVSFRNIEESPDDAWAYPAVTWIGNRALITYFNYKGGLSLKLKSLPVDWFYWESR